MLVPNTILQNRYCVIRELGHGGMGTVYEALDQSVSCIVALKETSAGNNTEARSAFKREAALLANLRHSALPKVMDYFSEGDSDFLVMEFIPGYDLAELLELRGSPFPQPQVLRWADNLLKVLDYLHGQNPPILHRDIKPSNLKLTKQGDIFLLDFGLAKGAAGQMPTLISNRSVQGYTPLYASIEQILGQGTDPRSDLYSLAVTLYHLLTGVAPVAAPKRFSELEDEQPDPLPSMEEVNPHVSANVAAVIRQAMSINRRQRPTSAGEMRKALRYAIEEDERHSAEEEYRQADVRGQQRENERRRAAADLDREEEERHRLEAEAPRKEAEAEALRFAAEAEARRQSEEDAARRVEEETRRRVAEEESRKSAAEEARRLADQQAVPRPIEEQRRHEEEARRRAAEEETRQQADFAKVGLRDEPNTPERTTLTSSETPSQKNVFGISELELPENIRDLIEEEAGALQEVLKGLPTKEDETVAELVRAETYLLNSKPGEYFAKQEDTEKWKGVIEALQIATEARAEELARNGEEKLRIAQAAEAKRKEAEELARAQAAEANQPAVERTQAPPRDRIISYNQSTLPAPVSQSGESGSQHSKRSKKVILATLGVLAVIVIGTIVIATVFSTSGSGVGTPNGSPSNDSRPQTPPGSEGHTTVGAANIEMVLVPAGTFTMGSPDSEAGRSDDEGPPRQVRVQSFYLGKYEVTQAQYQAVMGTNPSNSKGDNLPVETVSWKEAVEFCRKLSRMTGKEYRLPSEAEWEYASRAGTETPFSFGSSLSAQQANFDGRYPYGGAAPGEFRGKTTPVGSFQPNALGLYDMHGNVWEWCEDWHQDNYKGAPTDGSAWLSGGEQKYRVLRGGSWALSAANLRSANRGRLTPDFRFDYYGFRVVAVR